MWIFKKYLEFLTTTKNMHKKFYSKVQTYLQNQQRSCIPIINLRIWKDSNIRTAMPKKKSVNFIRRPKTAALRKKRICFEFDSLCNE